jgi:hypothetical protein
MDKENAKTNNDNNQAVYYQRNQAYAVSQMYYTGPYVVQAQQRNKKYAEDRYNFWNTIMPQAPPSWATPNQRPPPNPILRLESYDFWNTMRVHNQPWRDSLRQALFSTTKVCPAEGTWSTFGRRLSPSVFHLPLPSTKPLKNRSSTWVLPSYIRWTLNMCSLFGGCRTRMHMSRQTSEAASMSGAWIRRITNEPTSREGTRRTTGTRRIPPCSSSERIDIGARRPGESGRDGSSVRPWLDSGTGHLDRFKVCLPPTKWRCWRCGGACRAAAAVRFPTHHRPGRDTWASRGGARCREAGALGQR